MINTDELKHAIEMYVMDTYVEKVHNRMITQLLNKLSELKRLAIIGEATEKAFEDGKYITDASCKTLAVIDDLLDWAKED